MTCQLPEHRYDEHGNCRGCPARIPQDYFYAEPDERRAIQEVEAEEERKDHGRDNANS